MAEKQSIFRKLFGFEVNKNASSLRDKLYPTELKKDSKDKTVSAKVEFDETTSELFDVWLNSCHDDRNSWDEFSNVLDDMDMIFFNSPWMWRAMIIMRDEALNADFNFQLLGVESDDKEQREYVLEFIRRTGIEALLPDTTMSIVRYGNCLWILLFNDKGVSEVIPVDIREFHGRLEFTPYMIRQQLEDTTSIVHRMESQFDRINALIKNMTEEEDYGSYFKSYLFGYHVGDMVVPAWRAIHFRNYSSLSPFKPMGMPYFIHSVAPYRQFDMALGLRIAARGASFPTDRYKIKLPGVVDPTEKMIQVLELSQQLDNMGYTKTVKEGLGVGARVVTIEELFDYDQTTPNMDLGPMAELDMLENMQIISTGLPRGLLDPNESQFGESGVAFREQFKPFQRSVFQIQSILLQNITQLIKIDMIQSGKWKLKDINFKITLPFPESQVSREMITSQNDLFGLASTILDAIRDRVLGEEGGELPVDLIRHVFTQILPYDEERINNWINITLKHKEKLKAQNAEGGEGGEEQSGDMWESFSRKLLRENRVNLSRKLLKEAVEDTITDYKGLYMREGVFAGRHYYSSLVNPNDSFDVALFEDAHYSSKKLVEGKDRKLNLKEEISWEDVTDENQAQPNNINGNSEVVVESVSRDYEVKNVKRKKYGRL